MFSRPFFYVCPLFSPGRIFRRQNQKRKIFYIKITIGFCKPTACRKDKRLRQKLFSLGSCQFQKHDIFFQHCPDGFCNRGFRQYGIFVLAFLCAAFVGRRVQIIVHFVDLFDVFSMGFCQFRYRFRIIFLDDLINNIRNLYRN